MERLRFSSSRCDNALFVQRTSHGYILLLLYVDDMVITGDNHIGITKLQQYLSQQFEMKNLGRLSYFLSLEIALDSSNYYLSQAKYATDILSQARLTNNKVATTIIETNTKFDDKDETSLPNPTLY